MHSNETLNDVMSLDDWQHLQQLSKDPRSSSPIIMLLKTKTSDRLRQNGYTKYRWKIYLWQLPDDLISWYLPIESTSDILNLMRSLGQS